MRGILSVTDDSLVCHSQVKNKNLSSGCVRLEKKTCSYNQLKIDVFCVFAAATASHELAIIIAPQKHVRETKVML